VENNNSGWKQNGSEESEKNTYQNANPINEKNGK